MTDQLEPEISVVVNEIAEVVNWERLGISLGLNDSDTTMIRQNYDPCEHHQRLAEMLHTRDVDYSLSKLRREIDKLYPRRGSSVSVFSPQPEGQFGKPIYYPDRTQAFS